MLFSTALDGFWLVRERSFSPHTVSDYSLTFKRFQEYIGAGRHVESITAMELNGFLNSLRTRYQLSDKTLANVWIALSSFWTWAAGEGHCEHVVRHVPCPQYRRPPIEPYTELEIKALLGACDYAAGWITKHGRRTHNLRPSAHRDRAIIVAFVDSGLRVSELCDLCVRDYEPKVGRLTIHHGKGNKKRVVFLGDAARRLLWRYLSKRPDARLDAPLFATRDEQALDRHAVRKMIQRTAERAGVSHANCHRFRHTFAITFLRNGGNLLELQKLLGHEKIDTLQIYVDLAQTDLANAQRQASPADNWNL